MSKKEKWDGKSKLIRRQEASAYLEELKRKL